MPLRRPTESDVQELAANLNLNLSAEQVKQYTELLGESLTSYDTVESYGRVNKHRPQPRQQNVGHRVSRSDDPYNAWITKCTVKTDAEGPLDGFRVAVKDNIPVAGVEMTCASRIVDGYISSIDATLIERLLTDGATIIGKTNMDDMAFSGDGHESAFGPIRNPHDPDYLAGGSSGGSAVVVATGEADVAIGTDQGGSIRAPASWTGVVGHKPTFGLVPYTGCIGLEPTVDHAGPLAPDVETAARTLTSIAGSDSDDPRQPAQLPSIHYEQALDCDIDDISIGILEEGFTRPGSEDAVNETVYAALDALADDGATVEPVSMPEHADAQDIHLASISEATLATIRGQGLGHGWKGWYNTGWAEAFGKFRTAQADDLPPGAKLTLLMGAYTGEEYHSKYYAQAMNLRQEFSAMYDDLLTEYDVLAMPTTPMTAQRYRPGKDIFDYFNDAWANLSNTSAFNMTGHPGLSVPVGAVDDLPVGMMLVGKHFEDDIVLAVGQAVEKRMENQY